ncbi:NSFL1 cofactor p47-like [Homarus americanus]|uniref:NSFL1 cofactor p47-like n=1 Tax=Homarus americanus TaxID=6706 RepID=UPI001C4827F6|nr:NSFL1 cofactor p47-like [Homarus americanus]
MAERDSLVSQFTAVSGVDSERAIFFLESAAWNLESALSSFYEEGDDVAPAGEPLGDRPEAEGAPSTPQRPSSQPTQLQKAIINMMDRDGESSSEEDGQAFYAGGSEHSGQQVLGPPKKKADMVAKLFKSAKEHGAEVLESGKEGKKQKKITFGGTGYRLGGSYITGSQLFLLTTLHTTGSQLFLLTTLHTTGSQLFLLTTLHTVIPDTSKKEERPRDVALKMWRTGFTVDDGPLRTYEDATNAEFLNSIKRSEVPLELIREARGGEVYINMADHRHEDYVQSRSSLRAFSGSGHTLGSLAPMVVGQETEPLGAVGGASVNTTLIASTSKDPKALENAAQAKLNVNTSAPVTNIQVRLPDGSRLVLKVNHSHTIRDIRQFISAARPAIQSTEFALMTTFPYAELTDVSQTVEEGKLLNSALVVKTK